MSSTPISVSSETTPADTYIDISLSGHQVLALYHALRLQTKGIKCSDPTPVWLLNRRTGKRFTAKRWLQIITPYYEQITTGFKPNPETQSQP